jgi:hypothetical protein
MFQGCRPAGRLFYLALAVMVGATGFRLLTSDGVFAGKVEKAASSPAAKTAAAEGLPPAASPTPQSGPALTSVIDTVYMADGTPAAGTLVITWPAFVAADGTGVAPGSLDVTLGTNGALDVALVPNANVTPANTYYTVVYQLQPSEVRTEYWVVPTSSPATLAQVRTTPGSGTAAQPVSMQYVNTALAAKANDNAVVHLANAETITGTKSFAAPPNVPTPVGTGDVANKAYVDTSVASVGAGNYVPTAGGSMTGPLTLSADPTAPLQAADKDYVDLSAAAKADLISGLVPTSELGSGTASALNCLLGNGTWGSCGSSANATEIQSVPVGSSAPANGQVLTYVESSGQYLPATPSGAAGGVVTGPAASQNIAQPVGTQFDVNNLSGIRYVTPTDNWSVGPSGSLIGGTQATVTLAPCPLGVDTSGNSMYYVYVSGQGTPEAVMVTGGTCTSGAASGTIVFTPANTHAATYVVSSATSGIQEAINDACGLPNGSGGNPNARVVLPPTGATSNAMPVYGSIFAHCSRTLIEGNGTLLSCSTRDRCIVLGDLVNSNHYGGVTLRGVNMTSTVNADGCQITNTQRQSNVVTITVASGCSAIQTGDLVNINFTDSSNYWGSHGPVTVTGNSITYSQAAGNIASAASPGTIAIQNAAIEDNALPGTMEDIKYSVAGGGKFNQFFVIDNDQAATIRNFDNGGQGIQCTANHCGSFVYSAGTTASTPVLWLDKLNISAQCGGNGVTVYANNTVHVNDSVIQGFGQWGINTQNILGSYGGTQIDNVYNEFNGGSCTNPYLGNYANAAGLISGSQVTIRGGEQPNGWMPQFANTGTTQYNYFVVVNDTTQGYHSYPLYAGYALTSGSGTVSGQFPHVPPAIPGDTVTYDVIRMEPSPLISNGQSFPVGGACSGGSTTACGSVITAQAQCSGLVCTFADTASTNTSSYAVNQANWFPALNYWPGGMVLNGNGLSSAADVASAFLDTDNGSANSSAWISVAGNIRPTFFVRQCSGNPSGTQFGGAWESCLEGDSHGNNFGPVGGLLLNNGTNSGGSTSAQNLKGRLNFEQSPFASPQVQHLITLVDSNPAKTLATPLFRPQNDAGDTYIGIDQAGSRSSIGLTLGASLSISSYIGNIGDNSSYLERLTASAKTFKVPVTIDGNLTITGTCTGCGGGAGTVTSGMATQLALYAANGATVSGDSGLTDSGSTLNYSGSNGISAAAGTFSGDVTVNGQLLVAGPWMVSSPIPGTAMAGAGAGASSLGISNDGNFYISANAGTPQKVATTATSSFFSNLTQEDGYDVGQFVAGETTVNPQSLHVYSSYTNSSTWLRTSLGYDTTDSYAVVRSESSAPGTTPAPGLGFWINNGLKWVVDASGNLKPWTDQAYNLGTFNSAGSGSGLRPETVYAAGNSMTGSGFELGRFANESYELCNDTTTGTVINGLAVLTTAGCAIKPSSALTSGAIGVVIANGGTSGIATLAQGGSVYCSFDGTPTVIGDYAVPSSTPGDFYLCHDDGATRPVGTQILGRVLQASSGGTTVQMFLDMLGSTVSNSLTAAGTGSCTNQVVTSVNSGAPTCNTVTSAYIDTSIASTGTLVAGNYTKASGASGIVDSGVVTGPYSAEWMTAYRAGSATAFNTAGTKIELWGVTLQFPLNTSTLSYNVSASDTTTNTYDLGIYNSSGTLVAHTGAIAGSTAMVAGAHSVSWSGTNPRTLQPGKYYLAVTTSCTSSCATLSGDGSGAVVTFLSAGTVTTSGTQGTLDSSISVPADSYTWSGSMMSFIVR